jgi:DNA-binding MarR family transcriptional regulator
MSEDSKLFKFSSVQHQIIAAIKVLTLDKPNVTYNQILHFFEKIPNDQKTFYSSLTRGSISGAINVLRKEDYIEKELTSKEDGQQVAYMLNTKGRDAYNTVKQNTIDSLNILQ